MARVNITVPDELLEQARDAGLNVSAAAARALRDDLEAIGRTAALRSYLDELDDELGPIPEDEVREAERWADRVLACHRPVRVEAV